MIGVRYALVTVTAIFLSLAIGLTLGAALSAGGRPIPVGGERPRDTGRPSDDVNERLRARIARLEQAARYRDAFTAELGDRLVDGRLAGQGVVLVALPGADEGVLDDIRAVLTAAGGTVTGTVRLLDAWTDPGHRQLIEDVTARLIVNGVRLPDGGSTYDRAGAVLARALVTEETGTGEPGAGAEAATTTILGGFREAGLLSTGDPAPARAGLAVVVAPPDGMPQARHTASREGRTTGHESAVWVAVSRALDRAGQGCVLAGDLASGREAGLPAAVRSDRRTGGLVSSVAAVDLAAGRVALVWALAEQLAGGSGHYGPAGTTDGALPDRVPGD